MEQRRSPMHQTRPHMIVGLLISAVILLGMRPSLAMPASSPAPSARPTHQIEEQEAEIQRWTQERQQYRQAKDPVGEMQTLLKLGAAWVALERYSEAIAVLQDALPLTRQLQNPSAEAQVLGNLGIAYQSVGNYANAITTHRQAGKLMLQVGDRRGLGQVLTNLGNTFEAVGDYSNAAIAFQQSLKIAQQTGDRIGEIIVLGNLGAVYADQGKDQTAIELFQQSLNLAKAINYQASQPSALLNLGSTYLSQGKRSQAIAMYQESLKLAQNSGDRQQEAEALGALGMVYEDQKQFQVAIRYYQASLKIGRDLNNPQLENQALNNLGHALFGAGKLKEAEITLRQAIQRLDQLRPELKDVYRVSIFDTQIHTYNLLQQVLTAANQPEAALEATEWGRARAFAARLTSRLQSFNGSPTQNTSHAADSTPIRIADIKRIAREQKATLVEYGIVPDDDFKFRGKQRGRESDLLIWVVRPNGQVSFRRVDLRPLWKQDLDLTKLVAIARQCLAPNANCEGIATNQNAAQRPSSSSPTNAAKPKRRRNPALVRFYQLLIQPIRDLLPTDPNQRVVFIPLESLFLLPFPALQAEDGTYLIEQHTLLITPAIQVLALTRALHDRAESTSPAHSRRSTMASFAPALVVGNPTMPTIGSQPLDPLPAAEAEAQQIAALLQTRALTGPEANKANVVQQMTQAKLIHLATHGLLEYGQELGETDIPGAIALGPNPSAPPVANSPNGLLTANEILNLQLTAKLVVLSACDTGQGRITGDGVIGLSRSFISAGAPSVIVSLWAVSDASTAELMTSFYQNLLQQPDKATALRQAMLQTMQNYPRPLDWAAFTLIGEAD